MLKALVTLIVVVLTVVTFIVVFQTYHVEQEAPVVIDLNRLKLPPLDSSSQPVPDFSVYQNVVDKKKAFFAYLLPEVQRQNTIVSIEREMLQAMTSLYRQEISFTSKQLDVYKHLATKYTVDFSQPTKAAFDELMLKVDLVPEDLVLVQAAIESGWGASRFAKQGYNFFGLWCFKTGCGFVPKQRTDGAEHEVAKFKGLSHAVMTYLRNINRLYAYHDLREIRAKTKAQGMTVSATKLTAGLMSYSERGQDYIDELLNMLRVNRKYMGLNK